MRRRRSSVAAIGRPCRGRACHPPFARLRGTEPCDVSPAGLPGSGLVLALAADACRRRAVEVQLQAGRELGVPRRSRGRRERATAFIRRPIGLLSRGMRRAEESIARGEFAAGR